MDKVTTASIPTHSSLLLQLFFMLTETDFFYIGMCLEWFLFGKISVLCGLTCTLSKEVRLFPDLGIYSGIFVMYLQCSSRDSESRARTAKIIFYLLCLLYVLSMATVVGDILNFIFPVFVSNNSIFISYAATCPYTISSGSN